MTGFATPTRTFAATFVLACAFLAATAAPAQADITAFLGLSPTPARHAVRGLSVGAGFLIVGFEFEVAKISEDVADRSPGLATCSGNVLAQTPTDKVQLYGTVGAQVFRETLGAAQETHLGTNIGAGVKIKLVGPIRVRADYRIFKLQGTPIHDVYQRFYVGGNLKF